MLSITHSINHAMLNIYKQKWVCFLPTQKPSSVSVLGLKRSHIITITLSSLPSPHLLPSAIYSMDTTVLDREDLQVWKTERQ